MYWNWVHQVHLNLAQIRTQARNNLRHGSWHLCSEFKERSKPISLLTTGHTEYQQQPAYSWPLPAVGTRKSPLGHLAKTGQPQRNCETPSISAARIVWQCVVGSRSLYEAQLCDDAAIPLNAHHKRMWLCDESQLLRSLLCLRIF